MRILGIVLIVLGGLVLAYQGFSYVSRDTVAEVGSVKIQADREKFVWISPVVGAVGIAAGAAMLALGRKEA